MIGILIWTATIIAAYTLMRCLEIFTREESGQVVKVAALVAAVAIVLSLAMVWLQGISTSNKMKNIGSSFQSSKVDF